MAAFSPRGGVFRRAAILQYAVEYNIRSRINNREGAGAAMLFLLTGDVQIGKTRWLERLAAELSGDGVQVAGVLAPGVWRVREPHEVPGERGLAGEGRFEKLGIDNVLLPGGERVPFARRRDLALAEGSFDPTSQSASAQLAWEIADEAIARVNAHFDRIAAELAAVPAGAPALPGEAGSGGYAPSPSIRRRECFT